MTYFDENIYPGVNCACAYVCGRHCELLIDNFQFAFSRQTSRSGNKTTRPRQLFADFVVRFRSDMLQFLVSYVNRWRLTGLVESEAMLFLTYLYP